MVGGGKDWSQVTCFYIWNGEGPNEGGKTGHKWLVSTYETARGQMVGGGKDWSQVTCFYIWNGEGPNGRRGERLVTSDCGVKPWPMIVTLFIPPRSMKLKGVPGYTDFTLSFSPSVRLWTELCPQYLPDPFHMYTSYQATSEGVSHVKLISKLKKIMFWQIL